MSLPQGTRAHNFNPKAMKRIYPIIIMLLTCLSFATAQELQRDVLKQIFDSKKAHFDSLDYGIVGLYKDVQGAIHKSVLGYAAPRVKMTADRVFNIGSLTKTFTAVLILQEVEKGTLHLADTLGKFFDPELVNTQNIDPGISVENLLRHTSGLGEVIIDTIVNECFMNPYCDYNNPVQFNHIPSPVSKKNERYEYCNTNYILLGNILEQLNDKPYADLVRERVFAPCGMKNAFTYFSKSIPHAAHPVYEGEDLFEFANFRFYACYGFSAGGLASDIDGLSRFFDCLYSGKLFEHRETLDLMTSFNNKIGIGLTLLEIPGKTTTRYYGHDGDNLSFKCRNYYNPDTKEQLIFLVNQYGEKELFKITNEILRELVK